jgi:large subunit ribosomal protein L10
MSKFVKNLVTDHLKQRLDGVQDLLLLNVSALDANRAYKLRKDLRGKKIELLMVKNSLARRATEGTVLAPAFEGLTGSAAVLFGGDDIISLAKEVARLLKEKDYAKLEARGGVMDGAALTPEQIEQVSKWPSRAEQLSLLLGQILSPGATLASQLTAAGGALASQIKQKGEEKEGETAGEAPPAA